MLEPYAIVTARNVVASMWREQDRHRRNQHRVVDLRAAGAPDEDAARLARSRPRSAAALQRLDRAGAARPCWRTRSPAQDTRVAGRASSACTAGAVAAQLNRTRARLRVEYLLALEQAEPPTDRCRPVLLALSSGDRRRQREVDAARHLLECELCARLSQPLLERGPAARRRGADRRSAATPTSWRRARRARELAAAARLLRDRPDPDRDRGLRGRPQHRAVRRPRRGRRRAARRAAAGHPGGGPRRRAGHPGRRAGARATATAPTTGSGLGLPGARRLMDEFAIASETGPGTTVTMTKWRQEG